MANTKTLSRQSVPNGIKKVVVLLIAVYMCICGVSSVGTEDKNHPNEASNPRRASKDSE